MRARAFSKHILLPLLGVLLLLGLGLWVGELASPGSEPPSGIRGDQGRNREVLMREEGSPGKEARRERLARGKSRLLLEVTDPSGKPVPGKLFWIESEHHPRSLPPLLAEYGQPMPPSTRTREHEGRATLSLAAPAWIWLRATGPGSVPPSVYERIPPFQGEQRRGLVLDPGRRGIHALVHRPDFRGPASGEGLALFFRDLKLGGEPKRVREARTDRHGYAVLRDLEPGSYCVCAGPTLPSDPPPRTQRVILPPGMPTLETPVTLLASLPQEDLLVEVHARWESPRRLAPKLFLRPARLGVEPTPMDGVLEKGKQTLKFRVPAGDYEMAVLPLGDLEVDPSLVTVKAGGPNRVRTLVRENPRETVIQLLGLGTQHLPVHVHPHPEDPLMLAGLEDLFLGPYRWRRTRQKVRGPPGRFRLLISREKLNYWLSSEPLSLEGGSLVVALERASRVELHWFQDPGEGSREFFVDVETRHGRQTAPMVPALVDHHGGLVPAHRSVLFVPVGTRRFRRTSAETGKQLWEKEVQALLPRVTVRIRGSD